jgi:hypothetical protein
MASNSTKRNGSAEKRKSPASRTIVERPLRKRSLAVQPVSSSQTSQSGLSHAKSAISCALAKDVDDSRPSYAGHGVPCQSSAVKTPTKRPSLPQAADDVAGSASRSRFTPASSGQSISVAVPKGRRETDSSLESGFSIWKSKPVIATSPSQQIETSMNEPCQGAGQSHALAGRGFESDLCSMRVQLECMKETIAGECNNQSKNLSLFPLAQKMMLRYTWLQNESLKNAVREDIFSRILQSPLPCLCFTAQDIACADTAKLLEIRLQVRNCLQLQIKCNGSWLSSPQPGSSHPGGTVNTSAMNLTGTGAQTSPGSSASTLDLPFDLSMLYNSGQGAVPVMPYPSLDIRDEFISDDQIQDSSIPAMNPHASMAVDPEGYPPFPLLPDLHKDFDASFDLLNCGREDLSLDPSASMTDLTAGDYSMSLEHQSPGAAALVGHTTTPDDSSSATEGVTPTTRPSDQHAQLSAADISQNLAKEGLRRPRRRKKLKPATHRTCCRCRMKSLIAGYSLCPGKDGHCGHPWCGACGYSHAGSLQALDESLGN